MQRLPFLCLTVLTLICSAPDAKSQDLSSWVGQSAGTGEIHQFLLSMETDSASESYSTALGIYELNAFEEGLRLQFTRNLTLVNLDIHDLGTHFKGYEGELPFGLAWNIPRDSFLYKADGFSPIDDNPYRFDNTEENYTISVYYRNNKIELIRISGQSEYVSAQDMVNKQHWGIRLLPDGECVAGNCINGIGQMQWKNGMSYSGQFKEGISHGTGTLKNGTLTYEGEWKLGFLWGQGKLSVPNQYNYEGSLVMGKRAGLGTAVFANKTSYTGSWSEDVMEGRGSFYFSKNYYYTGQMRQNNINGFGKLTSPQGYVEGNFKNGKPHGNAKQFVNTSKTTMEGNWVNGKKEGTFKSYSPLTGNIIYEFVNDEIISKIEE